MRMRDADRAEERIIRHTAYTATTDTANPGGAVSGHRTVGWVYLSVVLDMRSHQFYGR